MRQKLQLKVKLRNELKEKSAKQIRNGGFLPAVLYSEQKGTLNLAVRTVNFEKIYNEAGESTLVDLFIGDGGPIKVIIKDVQKDGLKNKPIHVDFYRVNMNKEIEVELILNFINESRAVKDLGGVLIKNMESITVKCLPDNLLENIDIDLSKLETFSDRIAVGDISLPETLTLISDPNDLVVNVIEPRRVKEEEEETKKEETSSEETEQKEGKGTESGEKAKGGPQK